MATCRRPLNLWVRTKLSYCARGVEDIEGIEQLPSDLNMPKAIGMDGVSQPARKIGWRAVLLPVIPIVHENHRAGAGDVANNGIIPGQIEIATRNRLQNRRENAAYCGQGGVLL